MYIIRKTYTRLSSGQRKETVALVALSRLFTSNDYTGSSMLFCLAEAGVGDWMGSFPVVRFMINMTDSSSIWKMFGWVGLQFAVEGAQHV